MPEDHKSLVLAILTLYKYNVLKAITRPGVVAHIFNPIWEKR